MLLGLEILSKQCEPLKGRQTFGKIGNKGRGGVPKLVQDEEIPRRERMKCKGNIDAFLPNIL